MPQTPSPAAFARDVRTALTAQADADVRAGMERYLKGQVRLHGLQMPATLAVAKAQIPRLKSAPVDDVIDAGLRLFGSPFLEERQVGLRLLERHKRALPDSFVVTLEPVFDAAVREWASCDSVCGRVLRGFVVRNAQTRARIVSWSLHENLWRQRAAAVAFVAEAKTGNYNDEIVVVCERVVGNPERFVQLGVGWVLRELSVVDPARMLRFVEDHRGSMSREGLRYAAEKLPPKLRAAVMGR